MQSTNTAAQRCTMVPRSNNARSTPPAASFTGSSLKPRRELLVTHKFPGRGRVSNSAVPTKTRYSQRNAQSRGDLADRSASSSSRISNRRGTPHIRNVLRRTHDLSPSLICDAVMGDRRTFRRTPTSRAAYVRMQRGHGDAPHINAACRP
jgi:hypothetical protein